MSRCVSLEFCNRKSWKSLHCDYCRKRGVFYTYLEKLASVSTTSVSLRSSAGKCWNELFRVMTTKEGAVAIVEEPRFPQDIVPKSLSFLPNKVAVSFQIA